MDRVVQKPTVPIIYKANYLVSVAHTGGAFPMNFRTLHVIARRSFTYGDLITAIRKALNLSDRSDVSIIGGPSWMAASFFKDADLPVIELHDLNPKK